MPRILSRTDLHRGNSSTSLAGRRKGSRLFCQDDRGSRSNLTSNNSSDSSRYMLTVPRRRNSNVRKSESTSSMWGQFVSQDSAVSLFQLGQEEEGTPSFLPICGTTQNAVFKAPPFQNREEKKEQYDISNGRIVQEHSYNTISPENLTPRESREQYTYNTISQHSS